MLPVKLASAAAILAAGAIVAHSEDAHAFAEDLCYPQGGGALINCTPLPAACRPAGKQTTACKTAMVALAARRQSASDGGRSSVHTDVTYLLAQSVGFSATDAYWIAAYDEAADLGSFAPRDNDSRPFGNGAFDTASVTGFVRTNAQVGGPLLHVVTPYNGGRDTPPPGVDGLHPDPGDADVEPTLANFRAWAMAPSSAARPACTAGLTVRSDAGDYGTGPACFTPGTPIQTSISLFGPLDVPFTTQTGPQAAQDSTPPVYASDFDAVVATDGAHDPSPAHAADARLGIYLHMLADRISHHVCGDHSEISGPTEEGFAVDLSDRECAQPVHLLRHAWETGVDYALLKPQDRTTLAMLQSVQQELVAFARARGVLRPGADSRAAQSTTAARIAAALRKPAAPDRVAALDAIGCARGFTPFPGQPACPAR
jgi:hypothetical protein